jgi:hypothetical protein
METKIVQEFLLFRKENTPLEKLLNEKIKMIENYQTPRTAKEFYETIMQTIQESKAPIERRWFSDSEYHFFFPEQPGEMLFLYFEPNGTDTVSHIKEEKEIIVTVRPAAFIPGLRKDIFLGRNRPYDKMPTGIKINDKVYPLKYGYSAQTPLKGKLS